MAEKNLQTQVNRKPHAHRGEQSPSGVPATPAHMNRSIVMLPWQPVATTMHIVPLIERRHADAPVLRRDIVPTSAEVAKFDGQSLEMLFKLQHKYCMRSSHGAIVETAVSRHILRIASIRAPVASPLQSTKPIRRPITTTAAASSASATTMDKIRVWTLQQTVELQEEA